MKNEKPLEKPLERPESKKYKFIMMGVIIGLLLILAIIINIIPDVNPNPAYNIDNRIKPIESDVIYLIEPSPIKRVFASVYGTIYDINDNMTVYGFCYNETNHPIPSNASLKLINRNNVTLSYIPLMSIDEPGRFRYNNNSPSVSGNYLLIFNCTDGNYWAIATDELEIPQILIDIKNITRAINKTVANIVANISLGNLTTLLNRTNTTQTDVERMMSYFGIKRYSELDITVSIPTHTNYGSIYKIMSLVRNEYSVTMSATDVWCNVTTNVWGNKEMYYYSGYWRYNHLVDTYSRIDGNVTCERL